MSKLNDCWIQTYSGFQFWPLDPSIEHLSIFDIAHALSNICRFNGHTREFYSVAQHSCHVHDICPPADRLTGLLHDAPEAYITDLPRPLKRSNQFEPYSRVESRIMHVIASRWNLIYPFLDSVLKADAAMLGTEARELMNPHNFCLPKWSYLPDPVEGLVIKCWSPDKAKKNFIERFAVAIEQRFAVAV